MKKINKLVTMLVVVLLLATACMFACDNKPKPKPPINNDVTSIEVTNTETTLAPGNYVITAKCLPAGSSQGFTATLETKAAGVGLSSTGMGADLKYTLSVGSSAKNGEKIIIKVVSTYDPLITAQKEFTLAMPQIEYALISTEAELRAIGTDEASMAGNYKLTCDIVLTKNWKSLGDADMEDDAGQIIPATLPFKGILDGDGYSIKNINIPNGVGEGPCLGFFGQISDEATVCNIGFDGGKMIMGSWSGVVAACNRGMIKNVFTNVELTTTGGCAGALVATNKGQIEYCFALGKTISQSENQDDEGFVGPNNDGGECISCFADKETTGLQYFSGFRNAHDNAEWNKNLLKTNAMQRAATFTEAGYDPEIWFLKDGYYPLLISPTFVEPTV